MTDGLNQSNGTNKMGKKLAFLLIILLFILNNNCGLFEPEIRFGSISIQLVTDNTGDKISKAQESLSTVRCIVKKDSNTIHDQNHSKSGNSFQINIDNLEPADNYSVLLYGKNSSGDIIDRGYRSGISVTAGKETGISMTWNDMRPVLSSPADGSIITDDTPTFNWNNVSDASLYELEVDNSSSFSSPAIDQNSLSRSNYTPFSSLLDDTYYWRVRCKDSQGNWAGWSEVWSFTIIFDVPILSVSPTSLDFGISETSKTFNITNSGTGTLTWSASDDRTWISLNPTSGSTTTETDQVTVTVDRSSLSAVTYTGTVTVTSNGGTETISVSASNENTVLNTIDGGGIILTFDDYNVLEWYNADIVLSKYHWKATFFISHFTSLDTKNVDRLKVLQSNGHEIASHGISHLNAVEFVSSHSLDEYIETEIIPSIQAMTDKGFIVSSFAYPYGQRNKTIDKALLTHFTMIRGTVYGSKPPASHTNYANGSRVVFGLGIDRSYRNDINYILEMLKYAKDHNKIVIFYGHHIQSDDSSQYTTSFQTLEAICQYAVEHSIRFMTMKELAINQQMQIVVE